MSIPYIFNKLFNSVEYDNISQTYEQTNTHQVYRKIKTQ